MKNQPLPEELLMQHLMLETYLEPILSGQELQRKLRFAQSARQRDIRTISLLTYYLDTLKSHYLIQYLSRMTNLPMPWRNVLHPLAAMSSMPKRQFPLVPVDPATKEMIRATRSTRLLRECMIIEVHIAKVVTSRVVDFLKAAIQMSLRDLPEVAEALVVEAGSLAKM
jgi:hypothetical protein